MARTEEDEKRELVAMLAAIVVCFVVLFGVFWGVMALALARFSQTIAYAVFLPIAFPLSAVAAGLAFHVTRRWLSRPQRR